MGDVASVRDLYRSRMAIFPDETLALAEHDLGLG
jgi:hypothetical protein